MFISSSAWIIVLLLCFSSLNAVASAQTKMSIVLKNALGEEVFRRIRQVSDYTFVYDSDAIKVLSPLTLDVEDATIDQIMTMYLKDTGFTYVIEDNVVIIRSRGNAPQQVQQQPKTISISGLVLDSKKAPLSSVVVGLKGGSVGVFTDNNGRYTIKIPEDTEKPVLVFTLVGMKPIEIAYSGKNVINVVLEDDIQVLNDIVVTGIFDKSKESYTGAVRVITGKEMEQFQGRNIFTTLSNIDPSFNIIQNNTFGSDPNHLPEIQIRGPKNLPNINQLQDETSAALNTPLIVLDGFETTLERMMDLDNNEIELVTLLKDGSATALYGSRGANGIIVIKTKTPVSGKLRLSYRGGLDVQLPDLNSYHLLNSRDKLELERLSGYYESDTKDAAGNLRLQQYYNEVLAEVEKGVNTDWLSKPLRTGVGQTHNLKLEGGEQSFRYGIALHYGDVEGVMKGSDRQTFNGTVDLTYRHDNLIFRNSLLIGNTQSDNSPYGSFSQYAQLNPYWKPYDREGKLVRYFTPYSWDYWTQTGKVGFSGQWPNPMYDATLNVYDKDNNTSITNNFSIEWTPVKNLILRGAVGINTDMSSSDNFTPAEHSAFVAYGGPDSDDDEIFRKGRYIYSTGRRFSYMTRLSAVYSDLFAEKHRVYAAVSSEASEKRAKNYIFTAEGFPDESIDFLSGALQYQKDGKPVGSESTYRSVGVNAEATYTYDSRYIAELSYRLDGASQFGSNRRFAPFWSTGFGYNLHHESFIAEHLPVINRLKLRGSYGVTGSENFGAYQPLATYGYYTDDRYNMWFGAHRLVLGNQDLEWQITTKSNLGVEIELFHSRLLLEADVYKDKTSNLLSSLELPYSNGFTDYIENIGNVEAQGYELRATVWAVRDTKHKIYWSVTGNLIYGTDKIVRLSEAMKAANERLAQAYGSYPNRIFREGSSQSTIYVVPSLGIDPSTGKELFLNKDGEVTYTWRAGDRVAAGIGLPKYKGSFSTLFRYGNISFNTSFGFRLGGQLYNQTLVDKVENANRLMNVDERVFNDRWKQPGDKTFFRGINEVLPVNYSSRFVQDESTLICQNINISYDLYNKEWMSRLGIQSLRLSGNTGELFYLSTVRQERGLGYPFSRQFSMSLNLMF
jgi:TonB-linked SusC/RagA family outer membrane protein